MIRAESRRTARETVYLDMDHLVLLLLLWSSGLQAEGNHTSTEADDVKLVGGASRCAGTLEVKHEGDWRPVMDSVWSLKTAAVVCRQLDCGSAVSVGERMASSDRPVWRIRSVCVQSGSALRECVTSTSSALILDLTCLDSVRLLGGTSLCSGRLESGSTLRECAELSSSSTILDLTCSGMPFSDIIYDSNVPRLTQQLEWQQTLFGC
ncbi:scavenger receptor cysteine-rich type 1 protein M130-like [Micropterus salmoides]|uniref:scavenger receptor cysteine-rich type 1 protein M130-like n=1 Tax=Micropterus salmoides TaxID=27706 RepID=UPI0018EC4FBB|nr:scavenger receptor cysteine-rich type 1 protein M130-like [Micropterus salmoides]